MSIGDTQKLKHDQDEKVVSKYIVGRSVRTVVDFGALTDRGKVREKNEDHYAVVQRSRTQKLILGNLQMTDLNVSQEDSYLVMIADGVGGGTFGGIASELALRTVWEVTERMYSWAMKLDNFETKYKEIEERAATFTQNIQNVFKSMSESIPEMREMGTTLTMAYIMGPDVVFVNLGDSRAYVSRDGKLQQITHDHTLAQDLIDDGVDAENVSHLGHVLTRCFGDKSLDTTPDIHYLRLQDNDILLLCTDGLTDMIDDETIAKQLRTSPEPQLACSELVDLALEQGGKDNITVVVGRVGIVFS